MNVVRDLAVAVLIAFAGLLLASLLVFLIDGVAGWMLEL